MCFLRPPPPPTEAEAVRHPHPGAGHGAPPSRESPGRLPRSGVPGRLPRRSPLQPAGRWDVRPDTFTDAWDISFTDTKLCLLFSKLFFSPSSPVTLTKRVQFSLPSPLTTSPYIARVFSLRPGHTDSDMASG